MTNWNVRHKVFLSFHHADRWEVDAFIQHWAHNLGIFIPYALGVSDNDHVIGSTDTDYVMSQIRRQYLQDTTVTIVLVGSCTHSRRYVDWEVKASLTQPSYGLPNGLLAITLPSQGGRAHLPPRVQLNWDSHYPQYARFYRSPSTGNELASWIADAFQARTARSHLIQNPRDMMLYNRQCEVHGFTH